MWMLQDPSGIKGGAAYPVCGKEFCEKRWSVGGTGFHNPAEKYLWSAELYLAGAKESDIRDALRERQIRVEEVDWQKIHLLGDLGSEKLTDYYNLCDVFCMPSYFEAYGLVFAEALTYGLPCIGRDKFAMSEFIEDGCTGRLISGEDAEELALDLWEVLRDPKYREEVERRREWYLREYSWDKVAQRICSVMEKMRETKISIVVPVYNAEKNYSAVWTVFSGRAFPTGNCCLSMTAAGIALRPCVTGWGRRTQGSGSGTRKTAVSAVPEIWGSVRLKESIFFYGQ